MYRDVGKKLQTFAAIWFILVSIVSVIFAFVLGIRDDELVAAPFFTLLLGGPLFGYVSSLVLYGFGCIVMDYESEKPDENKSKGDSNIQWLKK